MRKQFLLNIIFLIALNVFIKPFWILGIDRTIQNTVGSEEYGWYFALFGLSFLFNSVLDLGVTNFSTWSIARNPGFLKVGYQKLSKLKLGLGAVYISITLIFALLSGYKNESIILLMWLSVNQFLLSFLMYQRSVLAGLQIFWLDSIFSVLDKALLIGICSYLLWFSNVLQFEIMWLVYAQFGAYLTVSILLLFVTSFKRKTTIVDAENAIPLKVLLKKSLPFALIVLFMTFYYRIDAFMIERILQDGKEQAGFYAQSFRLFDVANNFVFLFTGILFPMLSKSVFNKTDYQSLIETVLKILLVPLVFIVPTSIIYGNGLLEVLYTNAHTNGNFMLFAFSIAFSGLVLSSVYGTLLTASGNLSVMIKITGVGFGLNVLLNLILIPKYGILGAACASAFAQLFSGIFMNYTCTTLKLAVAQNKTLTWNFSTILFITVTGVYLNHHLDIQSLLALLVGFGIVFTLIQNKNAFQLIKQFFSS